MRHWIGFPRSSVWVLVVAIFVIGWVAVQRWALPTVLLDDAASLAEHLLKVQRSRPGARLHFPAGGGWLTYLEALLVCSCGAICLFVAALPRHDRLERMPRGLFLQVGILSVAIAADDLFLLHELLERRSIRLGQLLVATYGLWIVWILLRYRRVLLQQKLGPLLLALGCFALTEKLDAIHSIPESITPYLPRRWDQHQAPALLEEGFKWLGMVMWSNFFVHLSLQSLRARLTQDDLAGG